jgi:hypothetical protein
VETLQSVNEPRPRRLAVLVAGLAALSLILLGSLVPAGPAAAGSGTYWMSYAGKTVSMARIPATTVTVTVHSPSRKDRVVLKVGTDVLGSADYFTAIEGDFVADVQIDLSDYSGSTAIIARYTEGMVHSSVRKTIRVVPALPAATPSPKPTDPMVSHEAPADPDPTRSAPPKPAEQPAAPTPAAQSATNPAADGLTTTFPTSVPAASSASGPQPGADTTGVPAGAVLTASGGLWLSTPGQVVTNLDVNGCVVVTASNVTLRNVRIRCANPQFDRVINVAPGVENLVVEDSEIDGLGTADIGIGWSNYTLRRVEIRGTCDGARTAARVLIEGSWIHDMVRQGALHCDAIQSTEGQDIVVRGNVLDPTDTASGDCNNAAVMLGSETGTRRLDGATFEGNWMGGGNYSVNVRGDTTFTAVRFANNVYVGGARYGAALAPSGVVFEGNTLGSTATWPVVVPR